MASVKGLTIKKVRGKRHGTIAEKWTSGKQRNPELRRRPQRSSKPISNIAADHEQVGARPRKRKREGASMSALEGLPPEVLQQIFQYSANVDLPLTSRQLKSKLSRSHHLQSSLTSTILAPVLHRNGDVASSVQRTLALRLLNSRFMDWTFFQKWIRGYAVSELNLDPSLSISKLWEMLHPSAQLPPPRKLLAGPFSHDKISFLSVFAQAVNDIAAIDTVASELAREGLVTAVQADHVPAARLFLGMGLKCDTDILRVAVMDNDCDKTMVEMLLGQDSRSTNSTISNLAGLAGHAASEVDCLDPEIWSWLEGASDDKSRWLMQLLRDVQRRKDRRKLRLISAPGYSQVE